MSVEPGDIFRWRDGSWAGAVARFTSDAHPNRKVRGEDGAPGVVAVLRPWGALAPAALAAADAGLSATRYALRSR